MVVWSEQEREVITNFFGNLDYEDIGPKAICRYDTITEAKTTTTTRDSKCIDAKLDLFATGV